MIDIFIFLRPFSVCLYVCVCVSVCVWGGGGGAESTLKLINHCQFCILSKCTMMDNSNLLLISILLFG